MHFKRLKINNFGPFLGEHEINLETNNEVQKVILIGAMNGSGKTTLHEALQIVLFGKLSAPAKRFRKGGYETFLSSFMNKHTPRELGASIELEFSFTEDGEQLDYQIIRSWREKKGRLEEVFDLYVNGSRDITGASMWNDRIQDIFPPRIASLFFFDGEQIEELADIDKLSMTLKEAMYSLLGLDLVEQLDTDLEVLTKTKLQNSSALSDTLSQQIRQIEDQLTSLHKIKNNSELQIEEFDRALELRRESINEKQAEFKEIGGEIFEQSTNLQITKKSLASRKQKLLQDQRELAEGALVFSLIESSLLSELGSSVSKNEELTNVKNEIAQFQARDDRILQSMSKRSVSADLLELIKRALSEDLDDLRQKSVTPKAPDLDLDITSSAIDLLQDKIRRSGDEARANEVELSRLDRELLDIERKLAALPTEDRIAKLKGELESYEYDHIRLETLIAKEKEQLSSVNYKIQNEKSQLSTLIANQLNAQATGSELNRMHRTVTWVGEYLQDFKIKVIEHNIKKIEKLAGTAINELMRKKDFVSSVEIAPQDFALTLKGPTSEIINIDLLSAGERQIIATSILWALANASSISYPTIIDTPLGRLDSAHRKALCSNYFPNASSQIILLSTDEEIIGDYYDILRPHCAHLATLKYDPSRKSSIIETGYFNDKVIENVH